MKANLLKLEFFRLFRRPVWIVLALLLALILKGVILMAARFKAFGDEMENGFAYLSISATYSLFLIAFLTFIIAASSLSGEYASGLLRMYLTRPFSRLAWYLNRSLFLCLAILLLVLLDALTGLCMGGMGFTFQDAADPELQGPKFAAKALAWSTVESYFLSFVALSALASTGLFLSTLFRSPVPAISTAAGIFFFLEGVRHVFMEPAASYILTKYTSEPLKHLSLVAQGISEYRAPDSFAKALAIPLAYFLLTNILGLLIFTRRDVLD
jgi:ABC-2 type transport system permease protein